MSLRRVVGCAGLACLLGACASAEYTPIRSPPHPMHARPLDEVAVLDEMPPDGTYAVHVAFGDG